MDKQLVYRKEGKSRYNVDFLIENYSKELKLIYVIFLYMKRKLLNSDMR